MSSRRRWRSCFCRSGKPTGIPTVAPAGPNATLIKRWTPSRNGRTEVIAADLRGYFDSIPQAELIRMVTARVSDGAILALLKSLLPAPMVERNPDTGRPHLTGNKRGTPQGGVISPLLANLCISTGWTASERTLTGNERCELSPALVCYADDFIILSSPGRGSEWTARLQRWFDRHGLKLNEKNSGMRENCLSGSMRGGARRSLALGPLTPLAPPALLCRNDAVSLGSVGRWPAVPGGSPGTSFGHFLKHRTVRQMS